MTRPDGVEQPPAALAAEGQLHGLQPGLLPAGEAEVGLGADVSASVVAPVAGAVSLVRQALVEGRLDLALQLVGRCQPALRALGCHRCLSGQERKLVAAEATERNEAGVFLTPASVRRAPK